MYGKIDYNNHQGIKNNLFNRPICFVQTNGDIRKRSDNKQSIFYKKN